MLKALRFLLVVICLPSLATGPVHAQVMQSDTCGVARIGRALAVDTLTLRRSTGQDRTLRTTEGNSFSAFYAGDSLKVLILSNYRETGQSVTTYYFLTPDDYVISYSESFYDVPVGYPQPSKVVSKYDQFFYVCGGQVLGSGVHVKPEELQGRLRRVLRQIRP